jgi:hypothetical protein
LYCSDIARYGRILSNCIVEEREEESMPEEQHLCADETKVTLKKEESSVWLKNNAQKVERRWNLSGKICGFLGYFQNAVEDLNRILYIRSKSELNLKSR